MTLFDRLRESHEIQRSLCAKLARAKDDGKLRESLLLQLKVELEAHAAAEERYLYVPLLMDDSGLSSSRHALAEHHEIEEACEELSVPDKTGASWKSKAQALSKTVRHHLKEEESKFFKVAGRLLSQAEKARLAKQYEREVTRLRKKYAEAYKTLRDGSRRPGSVPAPLTPPSSAR